VSTYEVDTWRAVSFWTEKLTEVLIWSFSKIDISSVMQIKTQRLKNKVFKTQGPLDYLTQKYIPLPNFNFDDVIMSRGNRKILLTHFL
jgi:hypothetical protein